jgi:hypothetical protein
MSIVAWKTGENSKNGGKCPVNLAFFCQINASVAAVRQKQQANRKFKFGLQGCLAMRY